MLADLLRLVSQFGARAGGGAASQQLAMPDLPREDALPVSPVKRDPAAVQEVPRIPMQNNARPFIVSIEGNIGAGKSTMLKFFESYSDVELLAEPVDQWTDMQGHNLLQQLYQDPKRWSFQFQSYVQLSRLQLLKQPTNCSVKIIERSIQNNRYCFLENAKKEGSLCGAELEVLNSWYDWLNSNIGIELDLIVYLRTSPAVAHERLVKRGRKEEAGVPMQFIEGLHQSYEDWLVHKVHGEPPAPVLQLDANQDIQQMLKIFDQHKDEIRGKKPFPGSSSSVELKKFCQAV